MLKFNCSFGLGMLRFLGVTDDCNMRLHFRALNKSFKFWANVPLFITGKLSLEQFNTSANFMSVTPSTSATDTCTSTWGHVSVRTSLITRLAATRSDRGTRTLTPSSLWSLTLIYNSKVTLTIIRKCSVRKLTSLL